MLETFPAIIAEKKWKKIRLKYARNVLIRPGMGKRTNVRLAGWNCSANVPYAIILSGKKGACIAINAGIN